MPTRLLTSCGLLLGLALPALAAPQVATDIAPVHSLVARVMAGAGTPALIVPPGASPHGHALRPSQAAALERAELVFWMGEALTPWLEDAIETLAGDAHVVELLGAGGSTVLAFRDGLEFTPRAAGHDDHAHDDHDHAHDGADPHAWLDPANARAWVAEIARRLAAADPENAAAYAANAAAADAALAALDAELRARLAPAAGQALFVFHDAYGYLAAAYGLTVAGTIADGDAATPGARRLAAIREALAAAPGGCLFAEANHDPAYVETLAAATGIRTGVLDPHGVSFEPGPDLYGQMMRALADAIADCVAAD